MAFKVLIAPDKFKGSLTAQAAAEAVARGWQKARPADTLELLPISDGGDGFGQIVATLLQAEPRRTDTLDAAHRPLQATWGWNAASRTAVVESAAIIGLALLPPGKFHPFELDTFGLGAVLKAAVEAGAARCLVGIGGSATNEGGFGLARALGWRFSDHQGQEIQRWVDLGSLASVKPGSWPDSVELVVAVDVQNPLLGTNGCSRIYGPQKGLRPQDFAPAERCLEQLAKLMASHLGRNLADEPGAGAAGGLGFGLRCFAGARLEPGFSLFAGLAGLEQRLGEAHLVVTGEGAIDESSLMGKGVGELAKRCRRHGVDCIGLGGMVSASVRDAGGFSQLHALAPDLTTSDDAKARAACWLEFLAERVARGWRGRQA